MKSLLLVLFASLCAGCTVTKYVDRHIPVEVKVAVPVPCDIDKPPRPTFAFESARPEQELDTKVRLLVAERHQRTQYEQELEAALGACTAPLSSPAR